jgi:hypothetical protein
MKESNEQRFEISRKIRENKGNGFSLMIIFVVILSECLLSHEKTLSIDKIYPYLLLNIVEYEVDLL